MVSVDDVLAAHRASGREFVAAGVRSFVRDAGSTGSDPVVCLHGVPASSYLYLPGLGLAERPAAFDYSWTGLGRWALAACDAIGLDRFHLVVHDIGGPVGFEIATAAPERIRSLLILNTAVSVDTFRRPWAMEPFAHRHLGEVWLAAARRPLVFRALMRWIGVGPDVPAAEIDAYLPLLLGDDGGRALLRIMRSFERTIEKRQLYEAAVRSAAYPVGLLWGSRDPALPWRTYGVQARLAAGLDDLPTVPGKHFLPEDFPAEVAAAVLALGV